MKLGVGFPQTDIGGDPIVARDFAQAVEGMGYTHLAAYDHVVGANTERRPNWRGPYSSKDCFHDPFVLFGYLAGVTRQIEMTTQILILPQRQTVLVARQAASVDLLSGGRLRLGIGIGWNALEYVALGEEFGTRGKRSEEQAEVLRLLWTQEHVTYKGARHEIRDVGLNPMPMQRPIPLWFGGHADVVLRRIARLGDGWITIIHTPEQAAGEIVKLARYAQEAGRAPGAVGVDAWVTMGNGTPDDWRREVSAWKALGVRYLTLNTAFAQAHHARIPGTSVDAHLAAMRQYRETVADLL